MVILMSKITDLVNAESTIRAIKNNKRIDGRALTDFRNLEIKTGLMKSADGSAWVKLGKTEVIAGIKFIVGTPYPDSPNEGSMSLNLEMTGIASPDFKTGPPKIDAVEFGRVADRAIRSAETVDFEKLCIVPGEKVFIMFIDCYVVNADGNLIDATELAAISAIKNARLPKLDENHNIVHNEYTDERIGLKNIPVSITFSKVGDKIIVDPTEVEDVASTVRFSLGVVDDTIVSCQKSKGGVITQDEVNSMIDLAVDKYAKIADVIKKQN